MIESATNVPENMSPHGVVGFGVSIVSECDSCGNGIKPRRRVWGELQRRYARCALCKETHHRAHSRIMGKIKSDIEFRARLLRWGKDVKMLSNYYKRIEELQQ